MGNSLSFMDNRNYLNKKLPPINALHSLIHIQIIAINYRNKERALN